MKQKFAIAFCIIFTLFTAQLVLGAETSDYIYGVSVYGNHGQKIEYKNPPFQKDGFYYVPLEETLAQTDSTMDYQTDGRIEVSVYNVDYNSIEKYLFTVGRKEYSNKTSGISYPFQLTLAPELVNDVVYFPIDELKWLQISARIEKGVDQKESITLNWKKSYTEQPEVEHDYSFATSLLKQLPKKENSIISPIGFQTLLAMTAEGTGGNTQQQILDTIQITDLNAFGEQLQQADDTVYHSVNWLTANSIWVNKEKNPAFEWNTVFQNTIENKYNALADSIETKKELDKINHWIRQNTNGLIQDAVKTNNFELMLANAAYFKGKWVYPFGTYNTAPGYFLNKDKTKTLLDFMTTDSSDQDFILACYQDDKIKAVTMPFGVGKSDICRNIIREEEPTPYDMTFVLSDTVPDNAMLNRIFLSQTKQPDSIVRIPKFKIDSDLDYISLFQKMGITDLFDSEKADLSPMTGKNGYFVSQLVQNASISIDEEGTEATAVSRAEATRSLPPPDNAEYSFNKPFYYFLRNKNTGDILFEGYFAHAEK